MGAHNPAVRWRVLVDRRDHMDTFASARLLEAIAVHGARLGAFPSLRVQRNSYAYIPSYLDITVYWFSNAHDTLITVGVYRGRQLLGRVRRGETRTVGYPTNDQTYLTWRRPRRIPKGTKLRLVVSVRGGAAVSTSTRVVRAP